MPKSIKEETGIANIIQPSEPLARSQVSMPQDYDIRETSRYRCFNGEVIMKEFASSYKNDDERILFNLRGSNEKSQQSFK